MFGQEWIAPHVQIGRLDIVEPAILSTSQHSIHRPDRQIKLPGRPPENGDRNQIRDLQSHQSIQWLRQLILMPIAPQFHPQSPQQASESHRQEAFQQVGAFEAIAAFEIEVADQVETGEV